VFFEINSKKTILESAHGRLKALSLWRKKRSTDRKEKMEINKITEPLITKFAKENPLLREHLQKFPQDQWPKEIANLIVRFGIQGSVEEASKMLDLLWPTILWSRANMAGIACGTYCYMPNWTDLTINESDNLDSALIEYAQRAEDITVSLVSGAFPMEIIRKAGQELLTAAHLMTDLKQAQKYFRCFITHLVGYHFKKGELAGHSEIFRRSLKNLPQRGGNDMVQHLFVYLEEIDNRFQNEGGEEQSDVLSEIVQVATIALCRLISPQITLPLFLTLKEK
jgi:hypothetical protein